MNIRLCDSAGEDNTIGGAGRSWSWNTDFVDSASTATASVPRMLIDIVITTDMIVEMIVFHLEFVIGILCSIAQLSR